MERQFFSTIANQFSETPNMSDKNLKRPLPATPTIAMKMFEQTLPGKCDPKGYLHNSYLSINGWMCPSGIIYPCKWRQHTECVITLGFKTESAIEQNGWIKLSQMKWMLEGRYGNVILTDEQRDTIQKWHKHNNLKTDYYDSFK